MLSLYYFLHYGLSWKALSKEDRQKCYTEDIASHVSKLRSSYPDSQDYAILHMLIWSTLDPNKKCSYKDFPGDDSIEKFIDNLIVKYKK